MEQMAYNISIVERDQNTFNGALSAYKYEDRVQGLDASSLGLIKRLDLSIMMKNRRWMISPQKFFGRGVTRRSRPSYVRVRTFDSARAV